eukprot:6476609-Amphidinium_carterae.1
MQEAVDHGRVTADDLYEADELANQRTVAHGPLDPDDTWNLWADFANNVYHSWRVGPQLRERPEDEPRVRLPAEPARQYLKWDPKAWFSGSSIPNGTASSSCETRCLHAMLGLRATNQKNERKI